MKKILSFCLVAALGGLMFTSCNNDDTTNDIAVHGLQVLSAKTSFPSEGGTENIAVAQTPVQVYSNDAWATVAQNGQNIAVTASKNTDIQSRHTTVVIKATAQDSAVVDIDQQGTVFTIDLPESALYGDSAQTLAYKLNSENPVRASSTVDWIQTSVVGDSLIVSLAENNTGRPRSGNITVTSSGCTRSMTVSQDTFADWEGIYALIDMQNSTDDSLVIENCSLEEYRGTPVLYFSDYDAIVPVTWNQQTHLLTINAGTFAGTTTYRGQNVYFYMDLFTTDDYFTWNNSVSYDCPMQYEEGFDNMVGYFQDNGSYSGKTVNGIELDGYTTRQPSSDGNLGYWMISYQPALLRLYTFDEYDEMFSGDGGDDEGYDDGDYSGAKARHGKSYRSASKTIAPYALPYGPRKISRAAVMAKAKKLFKQIKR